MCSRYVETWIDGSWFKSVGTSRLNDQMGNILVQNELILLTRECLLAINSSRKWFALFFERTLAHHILEHFLPDLKERLLLVHFYS